MRSFDVRIDVSGTSELPGELFIAATVHLPDHLPDRLIVLVALPGGGYTRGYYDLTALPTYSQARFHTDAGFAMIAYDHLGVGDSSLPDPFDLSFENVSAAGHAAVTSIVDRLRLGTLAPDTPPVEVERIVGMGQSMGGSLLTVQQARHETFDAVAFLGWSGIHCVFPTPGGGHTTFPVPARGTDLREAVAHLTSSVMGNEDRVAFCFHWPEPGNALVDADLASYKTDNGLFDAVSTPWRSATTPVFALTMLAPAAVGVEAAEIRVPVLIATGERDVVPDPWSEPMAYRGSPDVSMCVVPRMAHMHNFAATRHELWKRVAHFARV